MGDGALIEFETAADAICTAAAIQQAMHGDTIILRAGIHVGDVTANGDDVFGEAVNMAARLEASARPGGCLVSKTAADAAGAGLGVVLKPEGALRLKGFPVPVDAMSIDIDGAKKDAERARQAADQVIRFATSKDGTRLAWTETGKGQTVVKAPNWLQHLEYDWTGNPLDGWLPHFSRTLRLIRFDARNNGLSDRAVADVSIDRFVEDLEAVFDAAGVDRAPVFGLSYGATVAAAFAAKYPQRVSGLILMSGYAQGLAKRNRPRDAALGRAFMEMSRDGWDDEYPSARDHFAQSFSPEASPQDQHTYAEFMKAAMTVQDWLGAGAIVDEVDIVGLLPKIRCRALVFHANRERVHSIEQGRLLAARIEGARYIGLDTANNLMPEYDPAWPRALTEIRAFLGEL
jgi:pimeloyl-ACP methyl ester carboxylesterase